jgi:hypothetical protein
MDKPSEIYIVKQKIDGVSSKMSAFYSIHEAYSNASKIRSQYNCIYENYIDCLDMENKLNDVGECFLWKNSTGTNWVKVFVLKVEDSKKTHPWLPSERA